jgi:hypothetical protein
MFLLDGKPLPLDTPFTTADGTQYPANWLRMTSAEEKAAIGITEVPDPVRADDRFYWNGDINMPKDLAMVKDMLLSQVRAAAYSLLSTTDYKLIRKMETGVEVDAETTAARTNIRAASAANKQLIADAATVAELAALQFVWPV